MVQFTYSLGKWIDLKKRFVVPEMFFKNMIRTDANLVTCNVKPWNCGNHRGSIRNACFRYIFSRTDAWDPFSQLNRLAFFVSTPLFPESLHHSNQVECINVSKYYIKNKFFSIIWKNINITFWAPHTSRQAIFFRAS